MLSPKQRSLYLEKLQKHLIKVNSICLQVVTASLYDACSLIASFALPNASIRKTFFKIEGHFEKTQNDYLLDLAFGTIKREKNSSHKN